MKAPLSLLAVLCLLTNARAMTGSDSVYRIKYRSPNEIIAMWNASNSSLKDRVRLDVDESTNSILITGENGDVASVAAELKKLDVQIKSFDVIMQIVKVEPGKKDEIIHAPRISTFDKMQGRLSQLSQDKIDGWILEITPSSINPELVSVSIKMQKVGRPPLSTEVVRQIPAGQKVRVTGITTNSDPKVREQVKAGKPVNTKNKSVFYYLDITVQESRN